MKYLLIILALLPSLAFADDATPVDDGDSEIEAVEQQEEEESEWPVLDKDWEYLEPEEGEDDPADGWADNPGDTHYRSRSIEIEGYGDLKLGTPISKLNKARWKGPFPFNGTGYYVRGPEEMLITPGVTAYHTIFKYKAEVGAYVIYWPYVAIESHDINADRELFRTLRELLKEKYDRSLVERDEDPEYGLEQDFLMYDADGDEIWLHNNMGQIWLRYASHKYVLKLGDKEVKGLWKTFEQL